MALLTRIWRWFDDITGISAALGPLFSHPVPRAGKSAWFYVLGSATLIAFLIQIVTGIALASGYVPSSGHAYDSLMFITGTRFGRIVRGIHAFGADAMIILIGLHAIRVYLMAAYKYPRQMNWLTGAGLLLFTLLMAFTGQLLRWDQTGFWSVVIAAEQAGRTPFIGNWLGHFILAGDTVQGATLSRFFAAHVFFIPALIFLFIGFHLYLVMHNGISEPPKAGRPVDPKTYRAWYHALVTKEGQPFWPDAAWRDVVFGFLVIVTVVALAISIGPPDLGRPPDPTIIQASPRPEWYFLWYYALLSIIPRWSEDWVIILGPAIFGAVLIFLPLVASKGERSPLRRPWSIVIVAFIVFMISYYGYIGHVAPWSPRMEAEALPASAVGTTSGLIAEGAKVFHEKGCEYCHTIAGYGGVRGPDLSYAGDTMTPAQMATRIYSGGTNMPSYYGNITAGQLSALLTFLSSRHLRPMLSPPPPVSAVPDPAAEGAKVFHDKGCEGCHSIAGHGGVVGPDLTHISQTMSPAQITAQIYDGSKNMPSYKGNLTPGELSELLAFFNSQPSKAGALTPVAPQK
ncbi:MAG TPA: cytochrome b N-terminal domain-containing protein [Bryobacteraceae bacterium]|nr:cytochrome b N-terminal domain-containing protein [Bryobacteraceae bacterium]